MAKLIGTAGHVDHGKTTLIQALTGIDADRLPEEKRRGMTIDIGFAFVDLPGHGRVSIVDVPGHERFLTNMLVGALGIDVALLCVAADESVMPQTREHFQILELLPVNQMVVALTRADLADDEMRAISRSEVESLLSGTRFEGSPIMEVTAPSGEGIDALRDALATALSVVVPFEAGPWYLPIDRAFAVKGYGTVVTGTLARGAVNEGDKAVLVPGPTEVRIRGIQRHGEQAPSAEPGMRAALNLGGIKLEDVHRGQAVGSPSALFETSCLDAKVRWLVTPKHGLRVRVSIGAAEGIGKVFLNDDDPTLAQVRLEAPVAAALHQPLIVRRYSPPELLGGGRVVVPLAAPRRKGEKVGLAIDTDSDENAILEVVSHSAEGAQTEDICRRVGKTSQALGSAFETLKVDERLLGFAGLWMTPADFASCKERLRSALLALNEAEPTRAALPRERALLAAKLPWSGKPLDRIIAAMSAEGSLIVRGTEIAHPDFRITLNQRQRELLDRVLEVMGRSGANTPSIRELSLELSIPIQAATEIVGIGLTAGFLVRIGDDLVYSKAQLDTLKAVVRELGAQGLFTAAAFRDRVGTSRRFAIPLLEYFDSIRLTTRVGEQRAVNEVP